MHHYPRHVGDYRKDTPHLSQAQHGAFNLLIDWYYSSEKPLPNDLELLCRIAAGLKPNERLNIEVVLGHFFTLEADGCWHQKRCDKEIALYQSRAKAGTAGMKSRYQGAKADNKPPNKPDNTDPNETLTNVVRTNARANHEPVTSNQKPEGGPLTPSARAAPVSVEEAQTWAEGYSKGNGQALVIEPTWVQDWFDHRASVGWVTGNEIPIRDWQADLRRWSRNQRSGTPSRPRRDGPPGAYFEKKGGVGGGTAAHPLAAPPCADWKPLARAVCEQAGITDFAWLETANWTDLASDDRQAVVDEFKRRQEGGAA